MKKEAQKTWEPFLKMLGDEPSTAQKLKTYNRIVKTFQARTTVNEATLLRAPVLNDVIDQVTKEVENGMIEQGYRRITPIKTQEAFDQVVGGCHEDCPARKDPEAEHDHGPPMIIPYACSAYARGYYVGKRKAREHPEDLRLGSCASIIRLACRNQRRETKVI